MNGEYNPGEERQSTNIKVYFKVKHSPDNYAHLAVVLNNYLKPKGISLETDGNELFIEV